MSYPTHGGFPPASLALPWLQEQGPFDVTDKKTNPLNQLKPNSKTRRELPELEFGNLTERNRDKDPFRTNTPSQRMPIPVHGGREDSFC